MSKPRVCVLADVRGWAWDYKGAQYVKYLSDEFDVSLHHQRDNMPPRWDFDLVHCFEVSQTGHVPYEYHVSRSQGSRRLIAGLTAHVWPTWGEARMHEWASRCSALHGNSALLVAELRQFHDRVFYTPNGVDAEFWQRTRPRDDAFTVCHVGKPNPRKGSHLIIAACDLLGIPLLMCQRTSHIALPQTQLRDEFYSRAWVQVSMSNMDGTPNPMLESAACGNVLISTRIGNMPEFITDYANGFLIERSADALVERLTYLSREWRSAARAMGEQARHTVLNAWTWEKQIEHVRTMWRSVLNG